MKIYKHIVLISTMLLFLGCSFEYENELDTASVISDVFVSERDFQIVDVITTYSEFEKKIIVERTKGLSKEVALTIAIAPELLETYNTNEGTNYQLLPESYYTIPESLTFPTESIDVEFSINFSPNDLFESQAGAASNYILPIRVFGNQNGTDIASDYSNILLNLNFNQPTVTVLNLDTVTELSFVSGVDLAQEIELESSTNFTTLDVSKIDYGVALQDVLDYNLENGTFYELLPESAYTIDDISFNEQLLTSTVSVHAALIDASNSYLLPLRMENTAGYVINQNKPIFVKVILEEIRLSFDGAANTLGLLTNTASASGVFTARLNSALLEDMPINLVPNNALVTEYNTANGTDFMPIEIGKISIDDGVITAGTNTVNVDYSVDISGMGLDGEDRYLLAFEVDQSSLLEGTIVNQEVIYVEVKKSLEGKYTWSNSSGYFRTESDIVELHPDAGDYKYRVKAFGTAAGWFVGFNLTTDIHNGNPEHLKIELEPAFGATITETSYFDTITGTLYFDIVFGDPVETATNTLSDIRPKE